MQEKNYKNKSGHEEIKFHSLKNYTLDFGYEKAFCKVKFLNYENFAKMWMILIPTSFKN